MAKWGSLMVLPHSIGVARSATSMTECALWVCEAFLDSELD